MAESMPQSLNDTTELNNGVAMPWVGIGTWRASDEEVDEALASAFEVGYRHIDTAAVYRNEHGVGRAIQDSGLKREDIFVTTKVWNDDIRAGADTTRRAVDDCLARLGLDYVDLVLMHWPVGDYAVAYRGLEQAYEAGKTRAIGVSNFLVHHLEALLRHCQIKPTVNQVEFHPYLVQPELLAFCHEHHIQPEAWAPLVRGRAGNEPAIKEIADRHGRSPAQIVLRWDLQKRVVTIPKSVHAERIKENAQVFDFSLSDEEMSTLDALDQDYRTGEHPDHVSV